MRGKMLQRNKREKYATIITRDVLALLCDVSTVTLKGVRSPKSNHLKPEIKINNLCKFVSNITYTQTAFRNATPSLKYFTSHKVKSVNAVQENNGCLAWRMNETHRYIVWVILRYCNVQTDGIYLPLCLEG